MNKNKKIVKAAAAGLAVMVTGSACLGNAGCVYAAGQEKEETVYVKAGADGSVNKTIVSNWLKNEDGAQEIKDVSELTDIKNVKGDETFTQEGREITWQAEGNDIYYQGETTKELPVGVKITYYLDGKEISPEELAGKSGKVKIRFDYSNYSKDQEVYTPFTMATGVILPAENFTNVEAENGKVISDGSKNIVIGMGFPGLAESLKLSESELTKDLEVPDYFEITADAKDFNLTMTATVAAAADLGEFGLEDAESLDDLQDSLEELQDASTELVDGSGELADGVQMLQDACASLAEGMNTLDEKTGELAEGIGTLDSGKSDLINGLDSLVSGINKMNKQKGALKKGADDLADGLNTLNKEKGTLKEGTDDLADGLNTLNEQKGTLTEGINSLAEGSNSLKTGSAALYAGVSEYTEGASSLKTGVDTYTAGADALAAGVNSYVPGAYSLAQGVQQLDASLQALTGASQALEDHEEAGRQVAADAKTAKNAAANLQSVAELADATISSLSVSIQQNQAVLETLQDVQSQLGKIPGDLIASYSAAYSNYVNVLETDISYLKNDISVQQKALDAWNEFKASADVEGLLESLDSIENGASGIAAARAASDPSAALAGIAQTVNGMAAASAPLAEQDTAAALTEGAKQLSGSSDALREGAKQLTDNNAELQAGAKSAADGAAALDTGIGQIKTGAERFSTGIEALAKGGTALQKGVGTVNKGIEALAAGGAELQKGVGAFSRGVGQLASGGSRLQAGAGTLSEGIGKLAQGSSQLKDGTAKLSSSGTELKDGVGELADGADTLRDGMKEFDEEGIQELTKTFDEELQEVLDRVEAVTDAGKAYKTFSGAKESAAGNVKFIIETGSIGE